MHVALQDDSAYLIASRGHHHPSSASLRTGINSLLKGSSTQHRRIRLCSKVENRVVGSFGRYHTEPEKKQNRILHRTPIYYILMPQRYEIILNSTCLFDE